MNVVMACRKWRPLGSRRRLPRCLTRAAPLDLLDHAIEIGIAGAKAPCEPVSTALCNPLAVSDNLELTGLPRRNNGFNVEALLDEVRETRDLGFVVLSCRAVNDLDLHLFSNLLRVGQLSLKKLLAPDANSEGR